MDVDGVFQPEMLHDAAPRLPEEEHRVRFVDHQARAVLLTHVDDGGEIHHVAVHGVHALHHHELLARAALQLLVQVGHVVVAEETRRGLREDDSVYDARVRVLVADHPVSGPHETRDHAEVRAEPGGEEQDGLRMLELREARGQLLVKVEHAGEDRRAARAQSVFPERGLRRGDHLGAVGQAAIVVGREVDEGPEVLPPRSTMSTIGRRGHTWPKR